MQTRLQNSQFVLKSDEQFFTEKYSVAILKKPSINFRTNSLGFSWLCSPFSIANETRGDLWNLNVLNFFSAWARKVAAAKELVSLNGALKNVNFWQIPILPDLLQLNRYEFLCSIKPAFSRRE